MSYNTELENTLKRDKNSRKKLNELKRRRFLMKSLISLKLLYPYLIDTGIILGAFSLFGATPFYRENTNVALQTKKTIDSLGNEKSTSLFVDEKLEADGIVTYYSKWAKSDNNSYERDIKKYDINQMDNYVVEKLIKDEKTIDKLEDIFGSSILDTKEVREYVSPEELEEPSYIETTIYSKDDNQIIKIKESRDTNNLETCMAILVTLASYGFIKAFRETFGYQQYEAVNNYNKADLDYVDGLRKLERKYNKKSKK